MIIGVAGLLVGIGIALAAFGLAASLYAGVTTLSTLFPIGVTMLFIAAVVAGGFKGG